MAANLENNVTLDDYSSEEEKILKHADDTFMDLNEMSIAIFESTAINIDSYIVSMTGKKINETITRRDEIFDHYFFMMVTRTY
jgi:hypothetical protein